MEQIGLPVISSGRELYLPQMAEITAVRRLTEMENLYTVAMPGGIELGHRPGQFVELSLFGIGEAPFSVSSSPTRQGTFELGVRRVGLVSDVLAGYEPGRKIGIRGPFGNGFDVAKFKGKDILIIAGGIGLVPMRSLINYVLDRRSEFGRLIICYGSRNESELLFTDELARWEQDPLVEYHITLDRGSESWQGRTGVVTTLLTGLDLDLTNTICAACGPPVMHRFVVMALRSKGIPDDNVYLSIERRMKCGVGKCGHCQVNGTYVCLDGPVYHLPALAKLQEAL